MLKFQRLLIGAFILLVPIIYPLHQVKNARDYQQMIFQYGVMIVAVFFVRNIWMGIFFCWTLILYYLNNAVCGYETVMNVFLGIILYGISRNFYAKVRFEKECKWIMWVGFISIGFMVLQYFHADPLHIAQANDGKLLPHETFNNLVGIFALKSHNGIFLALLVPILAMINPVFGFLMMFPVALSESSGAVMAGGAALLFFLWFNGNKRLFLSTILIASVGLGFFFFKDFKSSPDMFRSRFGIWHLTARESLLRPIGYGPDSFRNLTPNKDFMIMGDQDFNAALGFATKNSNEFHFIYYNADHKKMKEMNDPLTATVLKTPNIWDHPHNEYLNLLFCWGFVGLILFGFFMKDMVLKFLRSDKSVEVITITSMLIVYLVSATTQFPFSVARLAYLIPILLGAFDASAEEQC